RHAAFEHAHVIDHQHAVQVVVLVLHGNAEQTVRLELYRLAALVGGANHDPLGAFDILVDAWKREAPLFPDDLALAGHDLGIDENAKVARLIVTGGVDDEEPERYADLRCSEPTTRGRVHRLL